MPATLADPKRSLDSEQISPATIAHHTVYENTPNLHQSHICQWGAQPYLVGPLSRLVGKPPISPWLSENVLPLTQAGNDPNSVISLTEIFDRILFDVCNSLGFGVQKAKNGDRGTIVFTATLIEKDGGAKIRNFQTELEGCTDEELERFERIIIKRRGRATPPATAAPREDAPSPSTSSGMFMPSTISELRGRENLVTFLKRF